MERDARGRFVAGNSFASLGGKARAAKLTPSERRQIAKNGFQALARQRFNGKRRKAAAWLFDPLGYQRQELAGLAPIEARNDGIWGNAEDDLTAAELEEVVVGRPGLRADIDDHWT